MHNSKLFEQSSHQYVIIMITTICCIYCCKQLVYSFTRQLVYIVRNKGNEKKQNRKCLYRKYLIMGIGNGMKKGITGNFLHVIITIHFPEE